MKNVIRATSPALRRTDKTSTAVLACLLIVLCSAVGAGAAVTLSSITDAGIGTGGAIAASSAENPVIAFTLNDPTGTALLNSVTVHLIDGVPGIQTNMLNCIADASTSGISIYKDVNGDGLLDGGDTRLAINTGLSTWAVAANLCGNAGTADNVALTLSAPLTLNAGNTKFLIVIRTNATLGNAKKFNIQIGTNEISTTGGSFPAAAHTTAIITTDTAPPAQSNWLPAKSAKIKITNPTITFNTDENADCKWSLTDQAYSAMAGDCTGDGTTSQTCATSGLLEGAAFVYIACRDTLGNEDSDVTNEDVDYTVDLTAPVTSMTASSPQGGAAYSSGAWTKDDVRINTMTCSDAAGSGCNGAVSPSYCVTTTGNCVSLNLFAAPDNSPTCPANNTKTYYVKYRSRDNATNDEATKTFLIRIDKENPTTTDNWTDNWTNTSPVAVAFTANDFAGSGVQSATGTFHCEDTLNTCNPSLGTTGGSVSFTCAAGSVCSNYTRYYSVDNMLNTEASVKSKRVRQDMEFPVTTDDWTDNWTAAATVNVTLTPTDGAGSGLVYTRYCADTTNSCIPVTSGTAPSVTCAAGSICTQYIRYASKDNANNTETVKSKRVRQDLQTPATTDDWTDNWSTTSPITVALTASDGSGSGIQTTYYCVDTTNTCDPTTGSTGTSVSVSCAAGSVCTQYVRYLSKDNVNNAETVKSKRVRHDLAAPTTSDDWTDTWTTTSPVTVTLSRNDGAGSGILNTYYCTDGTNTCTPGTTGTSVVLSCAAGSVCNRYVRYYSKDNANNSETVKSKGVRQDRAAPTTTDDWTDIVTGNTAVTVTLSANDGAGSGVSGIWYCTDATDTCNPVGGTLGNSATFNCPGGSSCTNYVRYYSKDNVNNADIVHSKRVRQSTALPSTTDDWGGGWSTSTSINVTLTPASGGGTLIIGTWYCIDSLNTCTPLSAGTAFAVNCSLGSACTQYFRYFSKDNLGNEEAVNSTQVQQDTEPPTTTDNWTDDWTTSTTVNITLTPSDGAGSGLAATLYCVDTLNTCVPGTSGTAIAVTCAAGSACTQFVRYFSRDNLNNAEIVKSKRVRQDSAAPATTDNWTDNWSSSSAVTVTLSPGDGTGAGIMFTKYCVDTLNTCNPSTAGTAGTNVALTCASPSCTQYVRYYSADLLNNAETFKSKRVRLDPVLPSTTDNWTDNWTSSTTANITLTPSDAAGSGIAGTWYCIDTTNACVPVTAGTAVTVNCAANSACIQYVRYFSTDNAGNSHAVNSKRVRLDTQKPTTTDGWTDNWSFTPSVGITLSPDDATGAGIASTLYCIDTLNACAPGTSGTSVTVACAAGSACTQYVRYYSTDGAGNSETVKSKRVRQDTQAPSTADNWTDNWTAAASANITLTPTDSSGTGIQNTWYCIDTTDTCGPATGTVGTGPMVTCAAGSACTQYVRYFSADNLNNFENVKSKRVRLDTQAPATTDNWTDNWTSLSTANITLTPGDGAGAGVTNTWYCVDAANACAPGTAGTAVTVNCAAGSACTQYVRYFSRDAVINNETVLSKRVRLDTQLSSGGSITYADGYYTAASVSIALVNGGDGAGAGVVSRDLQRSEAALSNGACGAFGGFASLVMNPALAYPDNSVASGKCYRYVYVETDAAGNVRTYSSANTAKVDTSPPTCTVASITEDTSAGCQYATGSTVYYNNKSTCGGGTGSHTVNVTATDAESGIMKTSFPATLSPGGDDTIAPYANQYTYDTFDTFSTNATITVTNNAGGIGTCTFKQARDFNVPSGGSMTYTNGYYTVASVTSTFTAGADNVGGSGLAGHSLQRRSATLSGGACGTYGAWADLAAEPASPYTDNSVLEGNCYQYQYVETDNVANQTAYGTTNTAKINVTPPTCTVSSITTDTAAECQYVSGTIVYYNNNAGCAGGTGAHTVTLSTTDAGSGIQQATFPATVSPGGVDGAAPFAIQYSYDAADNAGGAKTVSIVDNAGLTNTCGFTVARDITAPPGGAISYPNAYHTALTVVVTTTAGVDNAGESGMATRVLQRREATLASSACGAFGLWADIASNPAANFDDISVQSGKCYQYQYIETDHAGNSVTYTSPNTAYIDITSPSLISYVYDGLGADEDGTSSQTTLSANWSAVDDPDTLYEYFYSIGSAPGHTEARGWTSVGPALTVTATGLSLADGTTYYFNIMAKNDAGLFSQEKSSDGIIVDITPPVAIIASPAMNAAVTGTIAISGTVYDNRLTGWKLYYGPGTAPAGWKEFASGTANINNAYIGSWNSANLSGTYTIKLAATDRAVRTTETTVQVTIGNTATITGTLSRARWNLVSVPIEPSNPAPIGMLGNGEYKIYRWDPTAQDDPILAKYRYPAELHAGFSYWIVPYFADMNYSYTGTIVDTTRDYAIALKTGWNQISSPFMHAFPWSSIKVRYWGTDYDVTAAANLGLISSTVYQYEDSPVGWTWAQGGLDAQLQPGVGYFIRSYSNLELVFGPGAGQPQGVARKIRPAVEYRVKLTATAPGAVDSDNYFGAQSPADAGFDASDAEEPPKTPDEKFISLYFPRQSWTKNPGLYANDIRQAASQPGQAEEWTFNVDSSLAGQTATLTWDAASLPVDRYSFTLINLDNNDRVDMTQSNSYSFTLPAGGVAETHFKIEVVKLQVALETKKYTLRPGWNLVSVPLEPEVTGALAQLGDDLPLLNVYQFAGGRFYHAGEADIQSGAAYWVYVSGNTEIDITGAPAPPGGTVSVPLSVGWNLIGDPFDEPLAWGGNIGLLVGNETLTLSEAAARGIVSANLYSFDGTNYTALPPGAALAPWAGYMLKADRDATLLMRK